MIKAIIAGGRDYIPTVSAISWLDGLLENLKIESIVSGCASGADAFGEEWALRHGLSVEMFPAEWGSHGKAAGPMRNERMAKAADICILFPGGRGTADMKNRAKDHGLKIFEYLEVAK